MMPHVEEGVVEGLQDVLLPGLALLLGEVDAVLHPHLEVLVEVHDRAVAEVEHEQDDGLPQVDPVVHHEAHEHRDAEAVVG